MKQRSRWLELGCLLLMAYIGVGTVGSAQQSRAVAMHEMVSARRIATAAAVLARRIDVDLDRVPLKVALRTLGAHAGAIIMYRGDEIARYTAPVTLHAVQMPLEVALGQVLQHTSLVVVPTRDGSLTVTEQSGSRLVTGTITGRVVNGKTGQPLRSVMVALDDASQGVLTDHEGKFQLVAVSAGQHHVSARLLGYLRQSKTMQINDGASITVEFALEPSASTLDQVVVTGTVIPTELKAVPNAMTVITAKDIEQRGITKIDQLFRGDVPGVFAQNRGTNALLDEVTMFSRGATALSFQSVGGGTSLDPLTNVIKTYIDGVEVADPKYLSQIDPQGIERIEILTGPQASTIYGSNAINGVMQIFTKRGATTAPQLTLNLLNGWVENNFSSARTPQHDYAAQLSGIEGRLAYNAGGSWNYMGPWAPAKQTTRTSIFGGTRLEVPTPLGRISADATFRRAMTVNRPRGIAAQIQAAARQTGWYTNDVFANGASRPATYMLAGQTLGFRFGYTPTNWWTHEFEVGTDVSDTEQRNTARGYLLTSDTTLFLLQVYADRRSLRYTTTARTPITSRAQITTTAGADAWQNLASSMRLFPLALTGTLTSTSYTVNRQPGHNTGGFLQTQLGLYDRLFLVYGLRAEWNPNYGTAAQPSYAPRYGIAYTQDFGPLTAKVRGSYGRSTRPPQPGLKVGHTALEAGQDWAIQYWGNFNSQLASPELGPEYQQGGEGGLELYLGARGSLIVTRYNQTVDGLIGNVGVDSVDLLPEWKSAWSCSDWQCPFFLNQYRNIGSIRNQGWELQESANIGPFTTRATYSWTKSRSLGVAAKYRRFFDPINSPQYQAGGMFQYVPEHTWATEVTYTRTAAIVALNVMGVGLVPLFRNAFFSQNLERFIRLPQNRLNMDPRYVSANSGYALADLTVSYRFSTRLETVLQLQNLMNHYTNDVEAIYATMGRQIKAGGRIHLQ